MDYTLSKIVDFVKSQAAGKERMQRNWDFYRNDVDRPPYYPYLFEETVPEYKARTKVAVGWTGALANRIASYFAKPPIEVVFSVDGNEKNDKAKAAAELWDEIAEDNYFDVFRVDVYRDAGVGGNAYVKERPVFFDHDTGRDLFLSDGAGKWKGKIKLDRISEAYVYPLRDGSRLVYIEAWVFRKGVYLPLSSAGEIRDDDIFYVEVIAPAWHDEITGKLELASKRAIWLNGKSTFDKPIPYSRIPLQRFSNLVSRPEVEDGISDIDAAVPLNNAINHMLSGSVRSIEYHGYPQTVMSGVDDESDIIRRPERVLLLPNTSSGTPATVSVLQWNQDITGSLALMQKLTDIMSAITGVPGHMLHDLEGAGKVMSGIALRLLYRNMDEVCRLKEVGFRAADEKLIKSSLDIVATHNDKRGHFDEVDVSVNYNPDRTPRDRQAEIAEDAQLMNIGFMNLVDFVVKWEPSVSTRKEAIKYLRQRMKEKAELREILIAATGYDPAEQFRKDGDEGSEDEKDGDGKGAEDEDAPAGVAGSKGKSGKAGDDGKE